MALDIGRKDTICALSSAQGQGAIAVIRTSGSRAQDILNEIFFRQESGIKPFRVMHGDIVNNKKELIDDVVAIYYPDQRSFTGEPGFEIYCHGNPIIVDQILQIICAHGARLAEPGEFSMRAVLNNKIDLAQAESIADLIHAKSDKAHKIALQGVKGGLSKRTHEERSTLISLLAEIEARMDFPDEDLGSYDINDLIERLDKIIFSLEDLLNNADQALRLHEGVRIVICGQPNAGKSTLLNRLCGRERAIVHEQAGTTRDVIEANLVIHGIPVTLVDVAGIRSSYRSEEIEQIGIERAILELKQAHLILWLADCTLPDPFGDALIKKILFGLDAKVMKVLNKMELLIQPKISNESLLISAKTGAGVDALLNSIAQHLGGDGPSAGDLFITRARQRDELRNALKSLREAKSAIKMGMVDEVIAAELRAAGLAFDRLFGTTLSEDVLDRIFSQFCIGK